MPQGGFTPPEEVGCQGSGKARGFVGGAALKPEQLVDIAGAANQD